MPLLPSCTHPGVLGGRMARNSVCVCVYTSAEGMASVKWRVSVRTCTHKKKKKDPQSSASRGGKCMLVCMQSITGSRKCPLKGPISNSTCKLGIEPLVEHGYAVTHPWHSVGGCLCVPCGFWGDEEALDGLWQALGVEKRGHQPEKSVNWWTGYG